MLILLGYCRSMNSRKRRTAKHFKLSGIESDEEESEEGLIRQIGTRVYFHSDVTKASILNLLEKLHDAGDVALKQCVSPHTARIQLFIHSDGGDAYAGLSGMDHIEQSRVPVDTIADGMVASAATFLLLGGTRRFCLPSSVVLIHQLSTTFWGKYNELVDEVKNSNQLMETIRSTYTKRTNLKPKQLERLLSSELTMTSEECINYGILEEMYNPFK